jgi:hypothetical protein
MVKCADCAFLGKRWGAWSQHFEPARPEERESGLSEIHEDIKPNDFLGVPRNSTIACYRFTFDLASEMEPHQSGKNGTAKLIQRDRDCGSFYQWIPFWTPHEQYEAQRMELLEKQRRDWEASQAVARQKYEDTQEDERRKWSETQAKERIRWESNWRRQWLPLCVATAGVLVSAVIGIMAALIQANATERAAERAAPPVINVAPSNPAAPTINVIVPTPIATASPLAKP